MALGGPSAGLAANLASYAIAIVLFTRIHVDESAGRLSSAKRGGLVDGLRYVLARRTLAVVVGGFAVGSPAFPGSLKEK